MQIDDLTIFISSCDDYEDTWFPFFSLLYKYWPQCNLPIILNTESKIFSFENLNIICPAVEKQFNRKMKWGERLLKTLDFVKTKYLLFLLDDFFIKEPVKIDEIERLVNLMKKENISHILLCDAPGPNQKTIYPNLLLRGQKADYRICLQAGLWELNRFRKYIKPHENPWQTERWASKRSQKVIDNFYCIDIKDGYIINYTGIGIGGIHRGKWLFDEVYELFERNSIIIDYNKRGITNRNKKIKRPLFKRIIHRIKNMPSELKSRYSLLIFH